MLTPEMIGKVKCFFGRHNWKRSKFSALYQIEAGFNCTRCRTFKPGTAHVK